jgi:transcriptional regulator with XRE-family HTH domain
LSISYFVVMKRYPQFGPVLRRLRFERGLSQEALAERAGMVSHAHLSRLESGHKQPTVEMVFRLAEALEIEAWEILKAMGDNNPKTL